VSEVSNGWPGFPPSVYSTLPRVGAARRAAMRNNVVFPAPFGPSTATNSPEWIWSEIPRSAKKDPKRFSIPAKEIPREETPEREVERVAGKAFRLASH